MTSGLICLTKNNVSSAYQLSKQQYVFSVLSDGFLIHDGLKNVTSGTGAIEQEQNTKLFRKAKNDLGTSKIYPDFNPLVYVNKS